jgi:hypothetical protein
LDVSSQQDNRKKFKIQVRKQPGVKEIKKNPAKGVQEHDNGKLISQDNKR